MNIPINISILSLIILALAGQIPAADHGPRDPLAGEAAAIVVIDPGHGGEDTGVQGPGGTLEKALMLDLARKIKARLVPDYEVRLTRDDDYQIRLDDRTGMANAQRAALFISLHAGAGFSARAEATTIYLHATAPPKPLPDSVEEEALRPEWQWQQQQSRHHNQSQRLGELLAERLGARPGASSPFIDSDRLPVLAGADMPAALLEFGDLNGAAGEKRLTEADWQQHSADAIAAAIRSFLSTAAP